VARAPPGAGPGKIASFLFLYGVIIIASKNGASRNGPTVFLASSSQGGFRHC
jgi:hypothetical protein